MDIFAKLSDKIDRLPDGDAKAGLEAVRLHVGTAIRHLERGERDSDETAFTDVILRCNHAFEGSVKEAYRVLAGKEPKNKTPAVIEQFLSNNGVLRVKVLAQFVNYRTEWRNPSTHDYLLDFDANEALLAIVSVTAFSIVLCDQIRGKLAFIAAESSDVHKGRVENKSASLIDAAKIAVKRFAIDASQGKIDNFKITDYDAIDDALAGYLSAELGNHASVTREFSFERPNGTRSFLDIILQGSDGRIAIETRPNVAKGSTYYNKTLKFVDDVNSTDTAESTIVLLVDDDINYQVSSDMIDESRNLHFIGDFEVDRPNAP